MFFTHVFTHVFKHVFTPVFTPVFTHVFTHVFTYILEVKTKIQLNIIFTFCWFFHYLQVHNHIQGKHPDLIEVLQDSIYRKKNFFRKNFLNDVFIKVDEFDVFILKRCILIFYKLCWPDRIHLYNSHTVFLQYYVDIPRTLHHLSTL